jgi:uncharacterized RDD family membrane protein YckC
LAPAPKITTPPAPRPSPATPEREKNWKEEIRQRVQRRRRVRGQIGGQEDGAEVEAEMETPAESVALTAPRAAEPQSTAETKEPVADAYDFSLRSDEDFSRPANMDEEDHADGVAGPGIDWSLGEMAPAASVRSIERPATASERFKAALLDVGLLLCLWTIVVYFGAKAARIPMFGLIMVWKPLLAYLAFLGVMYAAYFTGTTGCTPGKVFMGLKVVDTAGHPPTYARAFLRALLGIAGIVFGFIGFVPVFLDPARRALHDQLLHTRVIKR